MKATAHIVCSAWCRLPVHFISPPRNSHHCLPCQRQVERFDMASSLRSFLHCSTPRQE
ncbi:hypothetical protein DNTS_033047 [Danionella cerebrum]|uniref:Uncharacterized protein n=1 Tax=Danionella cerebrum TaxID=2873325 RepID=A0A553NN87_9TELE|nr:hypothetical protein DNTS_033047 [Danionella translucida]